VAVILLTRISPKRCDDDNAIAAMKPVLDGVAKAIGVNDSRFRFTLFDLLEPGTVGVAVYQRSEGKGRYGLEIVLRDAMWDATAAGRGTQSAVNGSPDDATAPPLAEEASGQSARRQKKKTQPAGSQAARNAVAHRTTRKTNSRDGAKEQRDG
jgi:hypothetical protein